MGPLMDGDRIPSRYALHMKEVVTAIRDRWKQMVSSAKKGTEVQVLEGINISTRKMTQRSYRLYT